MYFIRLLQDFAQYQLLLRAIDNVNAATANAGVSPSRCEIAEETDIEKPILIKLLYPDENVLYLIAREHGKLIYQDIRNNSGQ